MLSRKKSTSLKYKAQIEQNLRKPLGYWNDFANVERELRTFIARHCKDGVMPTQSELVRAKCATLSHAVSKHGGFVAIAERLGLQNSNADKPSGYWSDFANLEREIRAFNAAHGTEDLMPTKKALLSAKRRDILHAIRAHGGVAIVAQQLGLERKEVDKPAGFWKDFEKLEKELLAYISEYGTDGVVPTGKELDVAGRSDLRGAIERHGGPTQVAKRLGLAYASREYITPRTGS